MLHSVGTTAPNGLKIGRRVDGSGTKMAFKGEGNRSQGAGDTDKVCLNAQLRQIKHEFEAGVQPRRIRLKLEMMGDEGATKAAPKLQRIRMRGCGVIRECCCVLRESQI